MDEEKINATVERWSRSGRELILFDADYTPREQVAVLVRCEALLKVYTPDYGVIKWDRAYNSDHYTLTSTLALGDRQLTYKVGDKVSIRMSTNGMHNTDTLRGPVMDSGEIEITEVFPPDTEIQFYCYKGRVLKGDFSHAKDGTLIVHDAEIVSTVRE